MNAKTFEFFEFADAICKDPNWFTLNGTFGEVIAKLETRAAAEMIFIKRGHHPLDPFQRFLGKQGKYESVTGFVYWHSFREAFEDDETALNELRRLFREFRGKVYEIEDIGFHIFLEENDALKVYSVLCRIESIDDDCKEAMAKFCEALKWELEMQPLRKQFRWKPDID